MYARSVCCAASTTLSPSPCVGPYVTSQLCRPISLARRATFEQVSTPQCPLLSSRASSRPRQRFLSASTSCGSVSPSLSFFRGPQIPLRVRLCRVLNADANAEVEVEVDAEPEENGHSAEVFSLTFLLGSILFTVNYI